MRTPMVTKLLAGGGIAAIGGPSTLFETTGASAAMNDEALAGFARAGRLGSFDCLVRRYSDRVYAFCLRNVGNAEVAQDLTQATFVGAYSGLSGYNPRRPFGPWLFGIAANQCRMWQRRRRKVPMPASDRSSGEDSGLETIADESPTPESVVEQASHFDAIRRAVSALPSPYREVIVLRYVEDMPTRDVAEALGLSLDAVAKRLTRGTHMLRERLQALEEPRGGERP